MTIRRIALAVCLLAGGVVFADEKAVEQVEQKLKEVQLTPGEALGQAKAAGVGESEIRERLKGAGLSDAEIDQAMKGYLPQPASQAPALQAPQTPSQPAPAGVAPPPAVPPKPPGADEEKKKKEEEEIEKKAASARPEVGYFGYDIFGNVPAAFEPNPYGPIDPNYVVGPGDEVTILVWGDTEFRHDLAVSREGEVYIPKVGQVFVNGLTLEQMRQKLESQLSQFYSGLSPATGYPTTFMDVSLGKLRPIRVFVLGEVARPGGYTVNPNSTVFNSLYAVGGPTANGSLRSIKVIRNNKVASVIDLYRYLLTGEKSADIRLQNDDTIFIPPRGRTVTVKGEVRRPAIYELKEGERLKGLLDFAGGLRPTAYVDRIQIDRIVPFAERTRAGDERKVVDIELARFLADQKADVDLFDGDTVSLYPILDMRKNIVTVQGAVVRPGVYELNPRETVSSLVERAGGVLGEVYLQRADLLRTRKDLKTELIPLDLEKALDKTLKKTSREDVPLQRLDRLVIYSIHELVPGKQVTISGHVLHPGTYPLLEKMTLYDLVFKAGGLTDKDYRKQTYMDRADLVRVDRDSVTKRIIPFNLARLLDGDPAVNDTLRAWDEVVIYSLDEILGGTRSVALSGHVKRPGTYELYEENMTLRDLLFRAGGFQDADFRERTYLERADLFRLNDDRVTRRIIPFHLGRLLEGDEAQNYYLLPQDEIKVYSMETVRPETRVVSIFGAVKSPGSFPLETNMTLKDLILQAGGFTEDAYLYRAEIARVDPRRVTPDSLASILKVDLDMNFETPSGQYTGQPGQATAEGGAQVLEAAPDQADGNADGPAGGFLLQTHDNVYVRVHPDYQFQKNVTVTGEVRFPGNYALQKTGERLSDVLRRAGGLKADAHLPAARFLRQGKRVIIDFDRAVRKGSKKADIPLMAGDQIVIPPSPHVVMLQGEVLAPGLFKYVKGFRVDDYISQAGGYSDNGDRKRVYVEAPTGITKKVRGSGPKVADGSIIRVGARPPKKEGEPMDWTEFTKETASILASLATMIFVINQAGK